MAYGPSQCKLSALLTEQMHFAEVLERKKAKIISGWKRKERLAVGVGLVYTLFSVVYVAAFCLTVPESAFWGYSVANMSTLVTLLEFCNRRSQETWWA